MLAKILPEHGIERLEVARVVEPYAAANDVFGTIACLA